MLRKSLKRKIISHTIVNGYTIAVTAAAAAANVHAKTNDDGGDCVGTPIYTGRSTMAQQVERV